VTLTSLEVWESFAHAMRNYVRRRIDDPDSAEDVLQEVFLRSTPIGGPCRARIG
jgi:DNA-directed RNA polymerase specialized sigma24 family protein